MTSSSHYAHSLRREDENRVPMRFSPRSLPYTGRPSSLGSINVPHPSISHLPSTDSPSLMSRSGVHPLQMTRSSNVTRHTAPRAPSPKHMTPSGLAQMAPPVMLQASGPLSLSGSQYSHYNSPFGSAPYPSTSSRAMEGPSSMPTPAAELGHPTSLQEKNVADSSLVAAADDPEQLQKIALAPPPWLLAAQEDPDWIADGLKLQQEVTVKPTYTVYIQNWAEPSEFKRLMADVSQCINLGLKLSAASSSSSDQAALLKDLKHHLEHRMKVTLGRLAQSAQTSVADLHPALDDLEAMARQMSAQKEHNLRLREVDMVVAKTNLLKAKRRRQFQADCEQLASEILAKKAKESPSDEYADISAKVSEVDVESPWFFQVEKAKQESKRWDAFKEIRKLKTEAASAVVKTLLESVSRPETLFSIVDQAHETNQATTESPADDAMGGPSPEPPKNPIVA